MNNPLEHLRHAADHIHLSDAERARLRHRVQSFMANHPVRNGSTTRLLLQRSTSFRTLLTPHRKPMPVLIIAIIMTLSGGVSYAAEGSLPGDGLYPVKIHVNENIRATLAIGDEAEAALQSDLAARRLEEAATLAATGALRSEARTELQANFEKRVQRAEARIAGLRERNRTEAAAKAAAKLDVALTAHAALLETLRTTATVDAAAVTDIATEARTRAHAAAKTRADVDTQTANESGERAAAAASARMRAVEHAIAGAEQLLEQQRATLDPTVAASARAELDTAAGLVAMGETHLEAKAYDAAFESFQKAFHVAKRIETFLRSAARHDLKLNLPSMLELRLEGGAETNGATRVEEDADNASIRGRSENNARIEVRVDPSSKVRVQTETKIHADASANAERPNAPRRGILETVLNP